MQPTIREHFEQDRMLASSLGHGDPKLTFAFGEVEDVSTVEKHRRGRVAGVQPPGVHLGEVGDQRGLDAAGLAKDSVEAGEDFVVGE
jgi:hypothetical protein